MLNIHELNIEYPHALLIWGVSKIMTTFLGGPYNKDYNIFGSI